MQISVNGAQINHQYSNTNNLEDILCILNDTALPDNHIVGCVKVNGSEYSENYPGEARTVSTDTITNLEINTVSIEKIAYAALHDCTKILGRIIEAANKTAEFFRMYDEAEAYEHYANLIESLRTLFKFIDAIFYWIYNSASLPLPPYSFA